MVKNIVKISKGDIDTIRHAVSKTWEQYEKDDYPGDGTVYERCKIDAVSTSWNPEEDNYLEVVSIDGEEVVFFNIEEKCFELASGYSLSDNVVKAVFAGLAEQDIDLKNFRDDTFDEKAEAAMEEYLKELFRG